MAGIDVRGWSHVGIRVHDLARALPFYELLGFVKTMGPVGPEPVAILSHPCGLEINLVLNAHADAETNVLMDVDIKHPGLTHLALEVASVEGSMAALTAAGHQITEGPIVFPSGSRSIFVRDADGNVVELNEPIDASRE